ncbi:MAG: nitrogenase component 1 [Candidatus Marinarcus sp.]|uniref:nitrogenase component 1 n=1 Tax=Candidatus Marinarcus sp. TaxID=3100987 RepID=UPI003AFF6DE6
MAIKLTLKDIYGEESCAKSRSTKRVTCEKPEPGSSANKCAFQGAQFSLMPFTDCVHIVHAPATCSNAAFHLIDKDYSNPFKRIFTTDMGLNDLIFGCEEKLRKGIDYVYKQYAPKGIFIYTTCVSALIGEDINAIIHEKEQELHIPIIPVHAPGFIGNEQFGSKIAALSLLEKIGTREPSVVTPYDINLIGEYNMLDDMQEYTRLLEKLNIRVLSTFSAGGSLENIFYAHRAKLNVLISSNSLITFARKMKERWAIPWVNVTLNGKRDTSDALRAIAQEFKDPLLIKKTEEVIFQEEQKLQKVLLPIQEKLKNKKAILNVEGEKCWKFIPLLIDSGIKLIATSVDKSDDSDTEKAESYLVHSSFFMSDPKLMQEHIINTYDIDILLSERKNRSIALKNKISFFDTDIVKERSYISYQGSINFANDLLKVISNPVFDAINKKEVSWM